MFGLMPASPFSYVMSSAQAFILQSFEFHGNVFIIARVDNITLVIALGLALV